VGPRPRGSWYWPTPPPPPWVLDLPLIARSTCAGRGPAGSGPGWRPYVIESRVILAFRGPACAVGVWAPAGPGVGGSGPAGQPRPSPSGWRSWSLAWRNAARCAAQSWGGCLSCGLADTGHFVWDIQRAGWVFCPRLCGGRERPAGCGIGFGHRAAALASHRMTTIRNGPDDVVSSGSGWASSPSRTRPARWSFSYCGGTLGLNRGQPGQHLGVLEISGLVTIERAYAAAKRPPHLISSPAGGPPLAERSPAELLISRVGEHGIPPAYSRDQRGRGPRRASLQARWPSVHGCPP